MQRIILTKFKVTVLLKGWDDIQTFENCEVLYIDGKAVDIMGIGLDNNSKMKDYPIITFADMIRGFKKVILYPLSMIETFMIEEME